MQRADIGLRQDEAFLRRAFHKSLLPCVLSILSQNINILADGIIVGQRIGTDGLSAINLCVPVYLVLCIVGSFLVSGTAIQASRAIGRRQTEQSRKLYNTAVWSCVAAGLAVTAAGLALCAPISALLCPDETVRPLVMEYNLVTLIGALPKILIYVPFWFLRMDGRARLVVWMMLIMGGGNVVLDLVFLYPLGMGIGGAAWATVLAQLLSAAASLVYLRLRHPLLLFRRADMVIDRALLSRTVRFGAVAALHQSSVYIGKLLVQGAVNTLGAEAINAYTAATRIEGFANSFGDSGAAAEAVFIGQNVGGERPDRVRRGFFTGLRLMVGLGLAMAAVMFIWAEPLSRLVLPDSNAAELAESVRYLRLVSLFYVLCFIGSLFVGYFEGIGRISIPTIGSAAHLSLRVVLAWLLVGRMGLAGVALATGLGWCLVVSFQLGVYRGVILKRRQA